MQFDKHTSIYLQIANYMYEKILTGEWKDGKRIPSIREMAIQLEVNPNTVTRTYTMLQEEGTLENQRGIGYFTSEHAHSLVKTRKKREFINNEIPMLFSTMEQLDVTIDEIATMYELYKKETAI